MQRIVYISFFAISVFLASCATRNIPDGEVLLDKMGMDQILFAYDSTNMDSLHYLFKENKYPGNLPFKPWSNKNMTRKNGKKVFDNSAGENVSEYDMEDIFKQTPNRTIFGVFKFHLFIYSLVDKEKLEQRVKKKYARLIKKNERRRTKDVYKNQKRLLKGKEPKPLRDLKTYKPKIGERIVNGIGEAPVLLDSSKIAVTTDQLETYLVKKGYFNAEVKDTIIFHKKKPKATVYYIVKKKDPYRIRTIERDIADKKLKKYVGYALKEDSVIHVGQIFDVDKLQKERGIIEKYLLNRGYYAFSKDYMYYEVDSLTVPNKKDSTKQDHVVDLKMTLINVATPVAGDSTIMMDHQKHYISQVFIITDFRNDRGETYLNYDTLRYVTSEGNVYNMAYVDKFKIRASSIAERIFINPGFTYRAKEVEATYKQLSDLGIFRSVTIRFRPVPGDERSGKLMDCYIILNHSKRQSFTAETDGTNRGGNLGVAGSVSYTHRNLFKGAQKLGISLSGGLEVQQLITNQDSSLVGGGNLNPLNTFNTLEFGPSINLSFPKAILIEKYFKRWDHTATSISAGLNFQQRPDFTRTIQDVNFKWDVAKGLHHLEIGLWGLSALKISNQSQEFLDRLTQLNDPILNISFQDHIISSFSLTYTRNTQDVRKLKNVAYYSGAVELAGFMLRRLAEPLNLYFNPNTEAYELFGIRFAEYVRTTQDLRYYQRFNKGSEMVYRVAGGIGIPFENLNQSMPFERSFFAGGANGIRGWRPRLLGPGGYIDSTLVERFDHVGDIHLEANLEYRFDLFDFIDGALFVDAGNIWLLKESKSRPNGNITPDFYKEIAFAAGVGFRFDLDFFIVRLDLATKLKDPSLVEGERWLFQPKDNINALRSDLGLDDYRGGINFNFGIGYPF